MFHLIKLFYFFFIQLTINDLEVNLIGSALSGVDIESCSHPCNSHTETTSSSSSKISSSDYPCGVHGSCKPFLDEYICECPLGRNGNKCENILQETEIAIPKFNGDSFLHFHDEEIVKK